MRTAAHAHHSCPARLARPQTKMQEAKKTEEEVKKQQEQAANAYLHLNSYLTLPAPGGPDGGMGGAGGYGQPAYGAAGFQQF